jgi:formylglycine-generating enzyme
LLVLTAAMAASASIAQAQQASWPTDWNNWNNQTLWVIVGNPGNIGKWAGQSYGGNGPDRFCGVVDHTYYIGKFEVTAGQYASFLNAKAALGDTYGLYNTLMWSDLYGCKIQRNGSGTTSSPYVYNVGSDYANRPVNYVSYWDAARYANWLNNGRGNGDTETGAYTLSGFNSPDGRTIARNNSAAYYLPNEDEWYKAAYHDRSAGLASVYFDYPTRNNLAPGQDMNDVSGNNANYPTSPYIFPIDSGKYYTTLAGEFQNSASSYGTFDQGGNVWEWNETIVSIYERGIQRGIRGSSAFHSIAFELTAPVRFDASPIYESETLGFRVASVTGPVPEPSGISLVITFAVAGLLWMLIRKT